MCSRKSSTHAQLSSVQARPEYPTKCPKEILKCTRTTSSQRPLVMPAPPREVVRQPNLEGGFQNSFLLTGMSFACVAYGLPLETRQTLGRSCPDHLGSRVWTLITVRAQRLKMFSLLAPSEWQKKQLRDCHGQEYHGATESAWCGCVHACAACEVRLARTERKAHGLSGASAH